MKPAQPREPRTIRRTSDRDDKEAAAINNAFYVLLEMTSARRLSTLVRRPTRSEVLAALDDFIAYFVLDQPRERARELREAVLTWREDEEIPQAVYDGARRFILSLGVREPACGWANDDGDQVRAIDRDTDDAEPPPAAEAAPWSYSDASRRAAQLAQAVAGVMNIAGALASPSSWARATSRPSREHLVEHIDQLLSAFGTDLEEQKFAAPARTLRALLSAWEPGADVPVDISDAARELLAAMGIQEPPEGWDALEGPSEGPSNDSG
ncbi:hypothetical protein BE04_24175 [Sorangium cellulosum]|uniref:Uncharacterized protein n=2 Tax=Sorangium cellulosum TaxID=56 RepID=A0A150PIW3_SORCE|nr:hypothetical protein [Sorangium cellulosum]AGP40417.1 hypothetical protein SCE1572_41495 [Sorangium cellulosum So0157-2]KYF55368.1 hypothetical protein BE04_24175 [Sorangium cellulosum]